MFKLATLTPTYKFENWVQVTVKQTIFSVTGCAVYWYGALGVVVDHLDGGANSVRECLPSDMYRSLSDLAIDRGVLLGSILAIGANGGGFTLLPHFIGVPICNIVCVEMNSKVFGRPAFNL